MNVQIIVIPDGTIAWVPGPLPGSIHDVKAARKGCRSESLRVLLTSREANCAGGPTDVVYEYWAAVNR